MSIRILMLCLIVSWGVSACHSADTAGCTGDNCRALHACQFELFQEPSYAVCHGRTQGLVVDESTQAAYCVQACEAEGAGKYTQCFADHVASCSTDQGVNDVSLACDPPADGGTTRCDFTRAFRSKREDRVRGAVMGAHGNEDAHSESNVRELVHASGGSALAAEEQDGELGNGQEAEASECPEYLVVARRKVNRLLGLSRMDVHTVCGSDAWADAWPLARRAAPRARKAPRQ